MSGGLAVSAGAQGQSQGGQIQPQGVIEDFPALPRTQLGSLGALDEQQRSVGGGLSSQRQVNQSRLLPHLDGMLGQQGPLGSVEAEKKVSDGCGRRSG